MPDRNDPTAGTTDPWDPVVRGAAMGAFVVLTAYLLIAGVDYFTSDYQEFAPGVSEGAAVVAQTAPTPPIESLDGAVIAASTGCTGCHTTDGAVGLGPTWRGLAGSPRTFENGSSAVADAAYLAKSITDPGAQVVAGFPDGLMSPRYGDILGSSEIEALVRYIESLG